MKKTDRFFEKSVLVIFLLCFCFSHPAMAADKKQAAPALPADGQPIPDGEQSIPGEEQFVSGEEQPISGMGQPVVEEEAAPRVERTSDGKYYLDFNAASLINVLNVLSNLSGINFIAGVEVSDRKVSMTLDNVGLEDVLQSLAYGCNVSYDFIPGRNIYLFRAKSDAPNKPTLLTRVFKLYYLRATPALEIEDAGSSGGGSGGGGGGSSSGSSGGSSGSGLKTLGAPKASAEPGAIVKAVEKILSDRGKVSVDDRSNSLIVTDSEDRLKMIEAAIAALDRPLDQVLINVLLVETFEDLDRSLGIEWGAADGTFGVITGAVQDTNWPFFNGPVNDGGTSFWKTTYDMFKNTGKQWNPAHDSAGGVFSTAGTRDFSSFTITVKAMEDANKLKILAKPKVLCLDNQPALIKISTLAAIGTTNVTQGGGAGTSTSSTDRFEVGTILRVTPLINTGGRITLTVEPSFATVEASAIVVSDTGETGDPTVRTARTTLMVNDGQTIALGGMLFSTQSNDDRKVPFFGNIPMVGKALFTRNVKSIKDRELILFVTPYIVTDPTMLQEATPPSQKMDFNRESAPFWKVKDKEWYKELKDGKPEKTDFEGYFNIRKKLIDSTMENLDQSTRVAASSQS